MQVYGIIDAAQDGQAIANLAGNFGITEQQARTVVETVLPELAWSLERNTLSRGGLADLMRALGQGHHEQILDTPRAWSDPGVVADGQAILTHILGSDHKARALTARAAQASGLSGSLVEMLLPILAQMLMGAIARYTKGGLGDILSKLPIPGGGSAGDESEKPTPHRRRDEGMPGGGGGFELPRSGAPPTGGYPMPPMPPSPDGEPGRGSRGGFDKPWPGSQRRQPEVPTDDPDFRTGGGFGLPRSESPPAGGYPMPPMPPSDDPVATPPVNAAAAIDHSRCPDPATIIPTAISRTFCGAAAHHRMRPFRPEKAASGGSFATCLAAHWASAAGASWDGSSSSSSSDGDGVFSSGSWDARSSAGELSRIAPAMKAGREIRQRHRQQSLGCLFA